MTTTAAEVLITLLAAHDDRIEAENLGDAAQVSGRAVKAVWDRGLASWPGEEKTDLSREDWAEDRVKTFLKVAAGGTPPEKYTRDLGLLAKTHPMNPSNKPAEESKAILDVKQGDDGGVVTVDTADLQAMIDGFTTSAAE